MARPTHLKMAVAESGRTQREIARAVGLHEVTFSQYVSGTRVPPDHRKAEIAQELDRQVESLWPVPQETQAAA